MRSQPLSALHVGLEHPAGAVGNQNRVIQKLKEAGNYARGHGFVGWRLDDGTATQSTLLRTLIHVRERGEIPITSLWVVNGEPARYCQKEKTVSMVNGFYFAQL